MAPAADYFKISRAFGRTVTVLLISLFLGGVGAFFSLKSDVAVLTERVSYLEKKIDEVGVDRYYGVDAARDFAALQRLRAAREKQVDRNFDELREALRAHRAEDHK
jgi:hypothetical protein